MKNLGSVIVFCLLCLCSCFAKSSELEPTSIVFCYENKQVPPHYLGEGLIVPGTKPGAAIEIMRQLEERYRIIKVVFVRKPWKRCLNDLEQGKVDAIIGRYSEERAQFGVFPRNKNNKLNPELAFSRTMSCFVHDKALTLDWDGKTLDVARPIGAAVPRGYSLVQDLRKLDIDIYETATIELAHELLFAGKVQLSLSDCHMENKPINIVENPVPLSETSGYLIFSKRFYHAQPLLAKRIWLQLRQIDKISIYKQY